MFCKIVDNKVARGPQSKPVDNGDWRPYEEVKVGDIRYEIEEWSLPTFEIFQDKVVGTVRASARPLPDSNTMMTNMVNSVQSRLDEFAKTRAYDGILSACTYATSNVPKFATEGQYCVNKRDETWAVCYTILAEIEAETRPIPKTFSEIEPLLPELVWPV